MKPEPSLTSLPTFSAPNKMNDQLRFLWFSLAANALLLVCLTWLMIKPLIKPSFGSSVAAGLDMKAGYENGPIILLLDNEFDQNASIRLFDRDQQLMILKEDAPSTDEDGIKRAGIVLGTELELSCYYVYDPKPSFRMFQLTMGDRILEDINADGQYDLRIWSSKRSNDRPAIDVWFNNEWQEVIGGIGVGAKYRSVNTLKDNLTVSFDRTSGRWVPLTRSDQK